LPHNPNQWLVSVSNSNSNLKPGEFLVAVHNLNVKTSERAAGIDEKHYYDPDNKWYIASVFWAKVRVDTDYQRLHDQKHSSRLAAETLPCSPYPIVNLRNGILYAVDGQHRKEAFIERGQTKGKCCLLLGVDKKEEAKLFYDLNKVKNQTGWGKVKAQQCAGDAKCLKMLDDVKKEGFITKLENANCDLRSVTVIQEASTLGLLGNWTALMKAFVVPDEGLHKVVRNNIEFQRGIVDILRRFGTKLNVSKAFNTLQRVGAHIIKQNADDLCGTCKQRTNRHQYCTVMQNILLSDKAIVD
jgi:hypothetical protein